MTRARCIWRPQSDCHVSPPFRHVNALVCGIRREKAIVFFVARSTAKDAAWSNASNLVTNACNGSPSLGNTRLGLDRLASGFLGGGEFRLNDCTCPVVATDRVRPGRSRYRYPGANKLFQLQLFHRASVAIA